ncbi:hypothetical protein MLD38_030070 [Melastoma candidum]|uniref:Uncharacterized protein n=1 Tax=Melastoma candidum TaxID=119954 RepID=A0ACB9MK81_9MYRT|nr:hypothetical protein MLD38_030070 [Melastoma candidum]
MAASPMPSCISPPLNLTGNTDVFLYKKRPGELLDEIVFYSLLRKISNVMDSDAVHKARNIQKEYNRQQSHCVPCNKVVGIKFTDTEPQEPFVFHALPSSRVLFRMSGDEHDPSLIPPDEWFDPPQPVSQSM